MATIEEGTKLTHICKNISDELLTSLIENYNIEPYTYTVGLGLLDEEENINLKPIRKVVVCVS